MKKILLVLGFASLFVCGAHAQTIDADFEDGALPESWTKSVPESPYKGGYSVVKYTDDTVLKKTEEVGTNDLGGTYALKSLTGGVKNVKANSDNWLTSPKFTVSADKPVFSFRLAANCSYSPTKEADEKMQMDIVVIDGTTQTVLATIAPENYFTWKQYSFDLSAYEGKEIQVAFHDYGTAGEGYVGDMKYIDNIKLIADKVSDYSVESVTTLYGQAQYTTPYTINVTNYGCGKSSFVANYQMGDNTPVSETVETVLASGKSMNYTFKAVPEFTPGDTVVVKTWVTGADDAMSSNDALADCTVASSLIQTLPYAVCNTIDEDGEITDDLVQDEFSYNNYGKKYSYWYYDPIKYDAWIYSQTTKDSAYVGVVYLYTNKAFTLPKGNVTLKTIGTATLTDMKYEVYIAQYGGKYMAEYATKVGESEIMRDVPNTGGGIDTTAVVLDIPEEGNYIIGIRPINHLANAQMTIIGYSLEAGVTTDIREVKSEGVKSEGTYNLAGQRVNNNAKGIVITRGKKILNK